MKLIFDARFIRVDHHDGISRFSSELFASLSKLTELTALISDPKQLMLLPQGAKYIMGNDPTNALQELLLPSRLNKAGATHVFSPMQTMGSWGRRYKLILTLHDLIYYSHPKAPSFLSLPVRIAWRIYHLSYFGVRVLLNRADAVATVSNTSRGLIESKRLTKKSVFVLYNAAGSNSNFGENQEHTHAASTKRLVYMGSFMPYKNVEALVLALEYLEDFELVLLSKISASRQAQLNELAGKNQNRIVFRNGVSDEEYAKELQSAFALVSASKEEGFGIPLVEAMQAGIPLVLSSIPIFKEVAAEAALFFDPDNPRDIAEQIKTLDENQNWRKYSKLSSARARRFDWGDSATKLLAELEKL